MLAPVDAVNFTLEIPSVRNDFKVLSFEGTETISALYSIHVDLVSEDPDIELESLLLQPAFLKFGLNGEGIHGHIDGVSVGDPGKRLTRYRVSLVPALHYLQFSQDQRIFQNRTVPQIIAQVLKEHGIHADAFTFHVKANPPREYCTQYRENDLEFVQRLCAEDGIAWHHQHSRDGHLLVFTDDQTYFPKLDETPYQQDSSMVAEHPVVSQFSMGFQTRPSVVTRRHYDLKRPNALLESRFTAEFDPKLEDYSYPLLFESEKRGKELARQALERHRVDYQLAEGKSDQPALRSGHFFGLTKCPQEKHNDLWLLLSVTHTGKSPQVLEESATAATESADGFTQGYRNSFSAIPWDVFYRPPMTAPRSTLSCQTARVTGPVGEEIYCDEYGRVKVSFFWDRSDRNYENSSCWLRVASSWAGDNFGTVIIPRIGTEVLVTYLEGNPDNPLITGCLINKVTPPPYPLPENKTKTVLRSHSSPSTGGYNELSMEDRAGDELLHLRAQRDMEQKVGNDSRLEVGNESRVTVKGDRITVLGSAEHLTITSDQKIQVSGNNFLHVSGDSHTRSDETLVIESGQQVHIKAGTHLVIDGGESLSIKVGDQHIVLNADGIFSSSAIGVGGAPVPGTPAHTLLQGAAAGLLISVAPEPSPAEANDSSELEEEEEEVEDEGITLRIGVFFDGTGNNRSNSEMVAGCYARDVNLLEEAEDIQQFCQAHGYDGQGNMPDSSFGNDTSNVAKLYGLYADDSERLLAADETVGYIPVYLDGIGTSSSKGDSTFSQATGVGAHGVLARVEQSPSLINKKLRRFQLINFEREIERVEFDIFGFSRGAAAARHFANEVMKGSQSILASALKDAPGFVEGFNWRANTDVSINFIGIFDTAAAVAGIADGDLSVHDGNNPGVNLCLTPDIAKKIVHLVARDERRHNFSLNSAGSADIVLPGVHSDLGGGYLPNVIERVLLSKPRCSRDEDLYVPAAASTAYRWAHQELGPLQDQLNLYGLALDVKTWAVETTSSAKGDRSKSKNVYAAVRSERIVRNDLALVYLRIMRELAARNDVPFRLINDKDPKLVLPDELHDIAKKLMAFALGETRVVGLSVIEEELLYQRYIHLSANWNAAKGWNNSDLNIVFINRPAENYKRVVHPNA
ncbi:type VI secretion system tip protein TssI/VgrG [Pseudomonas sp. NPDC086278]|uniref:type VI secretion system tip protein TssI/VgrG n=1 Tax=Pseudomonas sp. NPDC086278 TaxID=3390646 RepID=UPI003CFC50F8